MLIARLKSLGRDYRIVHEDSPSGRGIDCGLIYDAKVFELASSKFHRIDAETTRDIVEAELKWIELSIRFREPLARPVPPRVVPRDGG
jgi:hypothetical protein